MAEFAIGPQRQPVTTVISDPFDLDITILEAGDGVGSLINLTDDGCKSSCPESCATNVA